MYNSETTMIISTVGAIALILAKVLVILPTIAFVLSM